MLRLDIQYMNKNYLLLFMHLIHGVTTFMVTKFKVIVKTDHNSLQLLQDSTYTYLVVRSMAGCNR